MVFSTEKHRAHAYLKSTIFSIMRLTILTKSYEKVVIELTGALYFEMQIMKKKWNFCQLIA